MTVRACSAHAGDPPLEAMAISRRASDAHEAKIEIAVCGVGNSDLCQVRSEQDDGRGRRVFLAGLGGGGGAGAGPGAGLR